MKNFLTWFLIVAVALSAVLGFIYLSRMLTTATVQIQTSRVSPTVVCAKIVTTDGAALSCWKE